MQAGGLGRQPASFELSLFREAPSADFCYLRSLDAQVFQEGLVSLRMPLLEERMHLFALGFGNPDLSEQGDEVVFGDGFHGLFLVLAGIVASLAHAAL